MSAAARDTGGPDPIEAPLREVDFRLRQMHSIALPVDDDDSAALGLRLRRVFRLAVVTAEEGAVLGAAAAEAGDEAAEGFRLALDARLEEIRRLCDADPADDDSALRSRLDGVLGHLDRLTELARDLLEG